MRKIWVRIDPWDKDMVTTALEGGAAAIMAPKGFSEKVKELGVIQTIGEDGDLIPGRDVVFFSITNREDEVEIARISREKIVVLECPDWTVIPIENLIARGVEIVAQVKDCREAEIAFGILEKGVRHILIHPENIMELKKTLSLLNGSAEKIPLESAEVIGLNPIGMGDRVCVDTCSSMDIGQGILVGNSSQALFLLHSESVSNPYVAPRPFRVNAGAVHAYTRVPGEKTRYLSELSSGDSILIVDSRGNTVNGAIGRLKIEKRPLMMITARIHEKEINTMVQNAETIRLVSPKGKPVSVVDLRIGDAVLVSLEANARHFGHAIEESIVEK